MLKIYRTEPTYLVSVDFKRTFKIINRTITPDKLRRYGVVKKVRDWFQNYLQNRYQQVKISNSMSSNQKVKYGVP